MTQMFMRDALRPEARPKAAGGAAVRDRAGGQARRRGGRALTLGFLLGPAAATAVYVWALATPQYAAEAAFMIRGREEQAASKPGLFSLGGLGSATAMLDGYAVAEFAASNDALDRLRERIDYDTIMLKAGSDPLMRFQVAPGGDEDLRYFNGMVDVQFSLTKQIVTLRAHAFDPADAAEVAEAMIEIVEEFANVMNERARADMLRAAEQEVADAAEDLKRRQAMVQEWRLANANIDPARFTEMVMTSIGRVEDALIEARIELARLNSLVEPGARGRELRTRIEVLTEELAAQQGRLTGAGDDSAARQAMDYERLQLAQRISQELYANAIEALAGARAEANRQQKFLVVVKSPFADDAADRPSGWVAVAIAFILSVLLWWIGRFLYQAATEGFHS